MKKDDEIKEKEKKGSKIMNNIKKNSKIKTETFLKHNTTEVNHTRLHIFHCLQFF